MTGTFDKWLSRVADLGQLFFWFGGASILGAVGVAVTAYVNGLAPAAIAALALLSLFALLGIASIAAYWLTRPKEGDRAPLTGSGAVFGQLLEKYALENARRFESEATQLRDELRETRRSREELEEQVTTLQQRLDGATKSALEMNNKWSELARGAIAEAGKARAEAQIAADAITEIELALVIDPTLGGLFSPVIVPPPPQERVSKAIEAVQKYRNSGTLARFLPVMQQWLAKANKPDPTDSGA